MVLVSNPSAPLIIIVGATGNQGGSVVKNLSESPVTYRVRAITRDPSKTAAQAIAQLGAEIKQLDIAVGNESAVYEAFSGADVVFGVTNFWQHFDKARDVAEGKIMADAARAAGARLFIFSGLPQVSTESNGKYTNVQMFDSKAEVVAYARTVIPTVDIQPGGFMSNIVNPMMGLRKVGEGQFLWPVMASSAAIDSRKYPFIDIARDYGLFVRFAIESDHFKQQGGTLLAYSESITYPATVEILEKALDLKINLVGVPADPEVLRTQLKGMLPPGPVVDAMVDSVGYMHEFGYFFGKEESSEQKGLLKEVAKLRALQTWEDYAQSVLKEALPN